jgi:glycosyltransferase involved in cell wall biosynthesis
LILIRQEPLISIIIPVYNREALVKETLNSILYQTYQNWECIVVDDGSTDKTVQIVQQFVDIDRRINLYYRPKELPKGANSCRNYGFNISKGEFINWFDSDDIMHPKMIEKKLEAFKNNPELDFVDCKSIQFTNDINNIIHRELWEEHNGGCAFDEHLKGEHKFLTPGPLFKKEFLINKELFNEKIHKSQEWDFFLRLFMTEPNYKVLNEELIHYRRHVDSTSSLESNVEKKYILESEARHCAFLNTKISKFSGYNLSLYFLRIQVKLFWLSIRLNYPELRRLTWKRMQEYFKTEIFYWPLIAYLFLEFSIKRVHQAVLKMLSKW